MLTTLLPAPQTLLQLPSKVEGAAALQFQGKQEPSKDCLDCILLFDGEQFVLERADAAVKTLRCAAVTLCVCVGGGGRRSGDGAERRTIFSCTTGLAARPASLRLFTPLPVHLPSQACPWSGAWTAGLSQSRGPGDLGRTGVRDAAISQPEP